MKLKLFFMTFLSLFFLSACQLNHKEETDATPSVTFTDSFSQVNNLEDAEERTGFSFSIPDEINGNQRDLIEAMDNKMIQVYYYGNDDNRVVIRKAIYVEGIEDISGDGTEYESELTHDINIDKEDDEKSLSVTFKGNEKTFNLAYWKNGDYLYSLYTSQGMTESQIKDLIKDIQ